MGIADILAEQAEQERLDTGGTPTQPSQRSPIPPLTLDPMQMTRADINFWLNVVQTVALVYIALKLSM